MDDYSDYVAMLAQRFGTNLRHYVVWNEAALFAI